MDGMYMYAIAIITTAISAISIAALVSGIKADRRCRRAEERARELYIENMELSRNVLRYRLKYGKLNVGDKNVSV